MLNLGEVQWLFNEIEKVSQQIDRIDQSCGMKRETLTERRRAELEYLEQKERELRNEIDEKIKGFYKPQCEKSHVSEYDDFKQQHPYITNFFDWLMAIVLVLTGYKKHE